MPWPTKVFTSYDEWIAAGSPAGGVFPVDQESYDPRFGDRWPARYQGVAAYYVALPTGQLWCPWQKAYNQERGYHGEGWNISGPPERMTATPSIAVKGYHGWLTDGVLTDG